jgi:hypothetical protein
LVANIAALQSQKRKTISLPSRALSGSEMLVRKQALVLLSTNAVRIGPGCRRGNRSFSLLNGHIAIALVDTKQAVTINSLRMPRVPPFFGAASHPGPLIGSPLLRTYSLPISARQVFPI